MATFTPPTRDEVVYFGDDIGDNLFSRLRATARGVNVYKLTNGEYTENQPPNTEDISKVFYGGHTTEITATEQAELIDAGYEDFIT
jgi:hypothetical protein